MVATFAFIGFAYFAFGYFTLAFLIAFDTYLIAYYSISITFGGKKSNNI